MVGSDFFGYTFFVPIPKLDRKPTFPVPCRCEIILSPLCLRSSTLQVFFFFVIMASQSRIEKENTKSVKKCIHLKVCRIQRRVMERTS